MQTSLESAEAVLISDPLVSYAPLQKPFPEATSKEDRGKGLLLVEGAAARPPPSLVWRRCLLVAIDPARALLKRSSVILLLIAISLLQFVS